ncbi:MAG TPA: hypothetical protein VHZ55_30120 [Bryobacteraceae bacterium]|nr:hypothetical protein [Bryobacteraceae bacterium]
MADQTTRRRLLKLVPGGLLAAAAPVIGRSQTFPRAGEFVRFADPTTETPVVRLTSPAYRNLLPAPNNRFLLSRARTLFFSSDRVNGRLSPCELDLKTGSIRLLLETSALDPASLAVDAAGRSLYFLEEGALSETPVNSRREKRRPEVLVRNVSSFGLGSTRGELFYIADGALHQFKKEGGSVLAEGAQGPCLVRPGGRGGCLFCRRDSGVEREFWYAPLNEPTKPVKLVTGRVSHPYWSADGNSVLFLRDLPQNQVFVATICEVQLESAAERCLAKTSQFAAFDPNGNDSVFVGASGSKAQPNVVLLLRATGRELTLCEHRASNANEVQPVFSPDSRRVFFQSDREGRSAIYAVNVERLVEPTGDS